MTKKSLLIPTLLCSLASQPSVAYLYGCNDTAQATNKTSIYFANGVGTSFSDADNANLKLQLAYKTVFESLYPNSEYNFFNAYNYTQGKLTDIVQVMQQKMDEEGISEINSYQLYNLIVSGLHNDAIRSFIAQFFSPALVGHFTDQLLQELGDLLLNKISDAIGDRQTVRAAHISLYEADLLAGKRVLILPHSQGNLFTNEAVSSVRQRQASRAESIDYYGIASPASYTLDGAQYVTAHDDRVIDLLRLFDNVLPSNLENDPDATSGFIGIDYRSFTNHLFLDDYFNDQLVSRTVIDQNLSRLVQDTPFPIQIAGTGAIRASLSWGDEPDVDLHVFEPNGKQVYYADKFGLDGTLDVDDTSGQGPENYVVACQNVQEGSYKVGVNYYSGLNPETAKVTIFLGDGRTISPREISLERAKGPTGDQNPSILFEINVSDDGNGNALYSVQ